MKPERNCARVMRIFKIEELLLTRNGLTVVEISQHFQVDRRTIYRDIELMQELGIPLSKDEHGYRILGTYKIPSYRPELIANASSV